MASGDSGRIVIEVEPEMKRRLYANLALTGQTLKNWFVQSAITLCSEAGQLHLFNNSPVPTQGAGGNGNKAGRSQAAYAMGSVELDGARVHAMSKIVMEGANGWRGWKRRANTQRPTSK